MSTKADKGDRKREIEQSPMKKKFRDSAISSEELDSAIASRIELAFKEHQSTLNSVVNSAVRDAVDSVLIPALCELREDILATNKSVRELREEFEAIVTKTKRTRGRVGSVRAAARGDGRAVADLGDRLGRLAEGVAGVEDRCRRNNVRLVGLPEGMEGPEAAVFLRAGLSGWIPSLGGRDIEVDRARRVCDGGGGSDRPRALIFRVLRWHGGSGVLGGAGQACPVKCAQNSVALLFFPGFGPAAAIGGGGIWSGFGEDGSAWSPALPHLSGGGWAAARGGAEGLRFPSGGGGFCRFRVSAGVLCRRSSGGWRGSGGRCFSGSAGGAWRPGWTWPWLPGGGWWQDGHGCLLNLFFAFSSLILGYCPYLSGTTISLLVRLTLHFSVLEGTNGE